MADPLYGLQYLSLPRSVLRRFGDGRGGCGRQGRRTAARIARISLIEYIEYYLRFDGVQGDMVSPIIDEKLSQLGDVYYLAVYAGRKEIIGEINAYYRWLGSRRTSWMWATSPPRSIRPLSRAKTPRNSNYHGQKAKAPPLREGLFHITIGASGAETVQLQQPKPPHPVPGTRRKKTGNPRLSRLPAVKRYRQQRVHVSVTPHPAQ